MPKNRKCIDCEKEIDYRANRCSICSKKGKLNWNYKNYPSKKIYYCKEGCNNNICYTTWKYGQGRCKSCTGKIRKYNIETRKKISKSNIGKIISKEHRKSISIKLKQRYKNKQNHPSWKGGISREGYSFKFNAELKAKIRKRDNYNCQNCGMIEKEHLTIIGKVLTVHHIDYNKKNCKENNLITVCLQCNVRANYNRNYWKGFYKDKIKEIYVRK